MSFFKHGSMSTEIVPENVLRAFIATYPELFRGGDLRKFGLLPDVEFGWPVGFSKGSPEHLGKLPSVGINCAACHVADVERKDARGEKVRVLGVTSLFDADAFFSAVAGATYLTQDPRNMQQFLKNYAVLLAGKRMEGGNPESTALLTRMQVLRAWEINRNTIEAAIQADPGGAKGAGPGGLQVLDPAKLELGKGKVGPDEVLASATEMLKLFHNMRTALHLPDSPPAKVPPPTGPGRNDAFGVLSIQLFGEAQPPMPVKFGVVWGVENRPWVHWDGNTRSPLGRNLLASIGLGAPLIGKEAKLDFAAVKRHTDLTEKIAAPKYPWKIDTEAAARGAKLYDANCASCHNGAEDDKRYFSPDEVGTDPTRARQFTPAQADRFNTFLAEVKIEGYTPSAEPGLRSTQKYLAPNLAGVWARSPYLHNGSVRTIRELLAPPGNRAATWHRGSAVYDTNEMGYVDDGAFLFDTKQQGNSNAGHAYGAALKEGEQRDLLEYLKSL
jgi:cytochrome c2